MTGHDCLYAFALLIAFALGVSILVFQALTGVPPHSSSASEGADVVALLKKAGLEKVGLEKVGTAEQAVVYELGSGWGSLVIALARAFPDARIRGIEISPLPYWVSRLRTRNLPNVHLHRGSFYDCDLTDARAVTCYLMTRPMPRLAAFLDNQLAAGTPVVSLSFWFRGRAVAASLQNSGLLGAAALYYWPAHPSIRTP
jgi:hypothetical protein